jgi:hypothetical protein
MTDAEIHPAGPLRSVVLAVASIALAIGSFSWIPFAAQGHEMGDLARVPVIAETAALILAILAIWLGDEVTQRGQLGRRIGMFVVVAMIGANLVGKAILG